MVKNGSQAFAIVEILIASSIVAIFIAMPVLAYSNFSKSQRDIKRKSDVDQIQQALVQYKSSTGSFPTQENWDTALTQSGYIPKLPVDPANGRTLENTSLSYGYSYTSDGTSYELSALLERKDKSAGPNEVTFYRVSSLGGGTTLNVNPATITGSVLPTQAPMAGNSPIPSQTPFPTRTPSPTTATPIIPLTFLKTFDDDVQAINDARFTSDGGYVIAGQKEVAGGTMGLECYVTKLNQYVQPVWSNSFSGTFGSGCSIEEVKQTSEGGYIVAGRSGKWTATSKLFLMKLTATGGITWAKTFGIEADEYIYSVNQVVADKGYIVAGESQTPEDAHDAFQIKFTSAGNLSWAKRYHQDHFSGPPDEYAYAGTITNDGGSIIAGYHEDVSSQNAGTNMFIVKTNSSGNVTWATSIGGPVPHEDFAWSVKSLDSGAYLIGGSTLQGTTTRSTIANLNSSGTVLWSKVVNNISNIQGAAEVSDGYLFAGSTTSFGNGSSDGYLGKIDLSGNPLWSKAIGGSTADNFVSIDRSGNYILMSGDSGGIGGAGSGMLVRTDLTGAINSCSYVQTETHPTSNWGSSFSITSTVQAINVTSTYLSSLQSVTPIVIEGGSMLNICAN